MATLRQEIKEEARKLQISAIYTAKGHFCASSGWKLLHYLLGCPLIIAGVLTTVFISGVFGTCLGVFIAVISGLITFLNPDSTATSHFVSGNAYNALYTEIRQFAHLDCANDSNISNEDLYISLKTLLSKKKELDDGSPKVPWWAYRIAKYGIKRGEASYDENLD